MSLKKAFFCLTLLFLLIALILSVISVLGISKLLQQYGTPLEMKIGGNGVIIPPAAPSGGGEALPLRYHVLAVLQLVLPVLFVSAGLLAADLVFYRLKLYKPLAELQAGAERIMQNDLDFSIQADSPDELGRLCTAFEGMRRELLKNNRELWRQMEERKRLNAAFSHDLRNPVAVLKGSARILQKSFLDGTPPAPNVEDSVALIAEYTGRIETYIDAMSSVGRLEELPCTPRKTDWPTLKKELAESIRLLTLDSALQVVVKIADQRGVQAEVQAEVQAAEEKETRTEETRTEETETKTDTEVTAQQKAVWLDKAVVFNVAENLIANAKRLASSRIEVNLTLEEETLVLSVEDDGPGFPRTILQKGAAPFLRGDDRGGEGEEQRFHFGMGLYVCRLLCEKHHGSLHLHNTASGARVIAQFNISGN